MWWIVPPRSPTSLALCSANLVSCNPSSPRPMRSINLSPRNPCVCWNSSRRFNDTSGSKSHKVCSWITGTPAKLPWIKFLMSVIGPSAVTHTMDAATMHRTFSDREKWPKLIFCDTTLSASSKLSRKPRRRSYQNDIFRTFTFHCTSSRSL